MKNFKIKNFAGGKVMTEIEKLIRAFEEMLTQSETEVRTKLVLPLFKILGYPEANRGEEFPVYGYEGGKPIRAKSADILYFSNPQFANYRNRIIDNLSWVYQHSLLVVEIKKRGESIDVEGQAIYYAAWTRSPLYVITNGEDIAFYKINSNFEDELIEKCSIREITLHWEKIYSIYSFDKSKGCKETVSFLASNILDNRYAEYCNSLLVKLDGTLNNPITRYVNEKKNSYFDVELAKNRGNKIEYRKVLERKKNMLITSEPGGGKTYVLNMLAKESLMVEDKIKHKVPIIIQCEYFGYYYNTIEEEILRQTKIYNKELTLEVIKEDLFNGRFLLLFDALDETRKEKHILIHGIQDTMQNFKSMVIVTIRKQNYKYEFENICELYEIVPLSKEKINDYIRVHTNNAISIYSLNLHEKFLSLLSTPLFLFITLQIIKNTDNYRLPKNKSTLFEEYFKYPIKSKITGIELKNIERILSKYAEYILVNTESEEQLIEIIGSVCSKETVEKYYNLILQTGVLDKEEKGPKFYHYTFLEYFYALQLAKYEVDNIISFLERNICNEKYQEIICLMAGIISDSNKQNIILDYLEKKDLKIFIKVMRARYKFETNTIDGEYEYSYEYFVQIRKTYVNLINTYFYNIKNVFNPWYGQEDLNQNEEDIKLIGSIDYGTQEINIDFIRTNLGDETVDFNIKKNTTLACMYKDDYSIPIISMHSNCGRYYFNLKLLGYGLDSSREIALQILEKQVMKLLKEKFDLNIDMNSSILMAEFIEDNLVYLKKKNLLPEEVKYISLYEDVQEVFEFLDYNKEKKIKKGDIVYPEIVPCSMLAYYCMTLKNLEDNIPQLLAIKPDIDILQKTNKQSYYDIDIYSDNQLAKAIEQVMRLISIAYRELIEKLFFNIKHSMQNYGNYIQFIWIKRDESGGILEVLKLLTDEHNDTPKVFIDENVNIYNEEDEELKKIIKKYKIKNAKVYTQSSSIVYPYLRENIIHERVYKLLKEDFENIFN